MILPVLDHEHAWVQSSSGTLHCILRGCYAQITKAELRELSQEAT